MLLKIRVTHPALPVALGWQGKMPQLFHLSKDGTGNLLDALPPLSLADKLKHRVKEREWGCRRSKGNLHAATAWTSGSPCGVNLQLCGWKKCSSDGQGVLCCLCGWKLTVLLLYTFVRVLTVALTLSPPSKQTLMLLGFVSRAFCKAPQKRCSA